ncbi:hypothetical protein AGMMS49983_15880 [Clostridia bacterium]|nr:hypothetical protein AGMMS49983_15880 [Clostridia bacterium]
MMNRTERAIEFNKSMIMQEHLDWKNEGRAEGRVEGIEIGEKRSKIDTARQMKKKGYAPEEIREITGISLRDLKGL